MKRQMLSLVVVAFLLSACSNQSGLNDISNTTGSSVDTSQLIALVEQSNVDADTYEMTGAMVPYTHAVASYSHLCYEDDATQEEIDAAVSEIERLREAVVSPAPTHKPDVNLLPVYSDFVDSADERVGQYYRVEGNVTNVSGGFRGDDYIVGVYWDETDTQGEVAIVRIPYHSYSDSVHTFFSGDCELEGLDDNGHPQFVCDTYSVERP